MQHLSIALLLALSCSHATSPTHLPRKVAQQLKNDAARVAGIVQVAEQALAGEATGADLDEAARATRNEISRLRQEGREEEAAKLGTLMEKLDASQAEKLKVRRSGMRFSAWMQGCLAG